MKFNRLIQHILGVTNHEGEYAFRLDRATELYTAVVTWNLNDSFYEKNTTRLSRVKALIAKNDPVFVGKLAVYARTKMHLRSAPLVLLTELAKLHSGDNLVSRVTEKVVIRADEITELLACYELLNDRNRKKKLNRLSKQLQKGLQSAFNRFDEYQFAKYNRNTGIRLRDALFLVHPKAKDDAQQNIFNKIAAGAMQTPYTWETELSALGKRSFDGKLARANALRQKWEELIDSGRIGYMALLRNLRNIYEATVSEEHLEKVCTMLTSAENIARAKQFPFRYLAAYRELSSRLTRADWSLRSNNSGTAVKSAKEKLCDALEEAVSISAANIKGFNGKTRVLIACDVSGSMQTPISEKSTIRLYDIGLMLAMLLQSRCANVRTGIFGDSWKVINMPKHHILHNVEEFYKREGEVGYATNGYLVIKELLSDRIKMDKVMIFTDGQLWDSYGYGGNINELWKLYTRSVAPEARLYLFDLKGHSTTPLKVLNNNVYLIAGWSDKIFEILDAMENGRSALNEIHQIVI
ncbi:TROVE domain-containing protein [Pedobacter sp. KBW06]|uniref:TROVE domain-containing protein n=1 Tax=Pedobacter sp. KBW06 TaxID=2153359 RepID=UPI000F594FFC|nr:TROVE domain-containing protein [Pedobacter sp. KBW06]RQO74881.1 TROVE domain-containing protein [Pedobacter sp. KBW06]